MNKAVLISIRPKWCELIASRKKTIEVRKTRPKLETPFKCYMYMSAYHWAFSLLREYGMEELADRLMHETGEVTGEFVCDRIFTITIEQNTPFSEERGGGYDEGYSSLGYRDCLSDEEFDSYLDGKNGYGWHISDLVIYDEPKKLKEFWSWNTRVVFEDGFPMPTHEIKRPPQSWCYVEEVN